MYSMDCTNAKSTTHTERSHKAKSAEISMDFCITRSIQHKGRQYKPSIGEMSPNFIVVESIQLVKRQYKVNTPEISVNLTKCDKGRVGPLPWLQQGCHAKVCTRSGHVQNRRSMYALGCAVYIALSISPSMIALGFVMGCAAQRAGEWLCYLAPILFGLW